MTVKKGVKGETTKETVVKPDTDTKVIELAYLASEDDLHKAKQSVKAKQEEIKRKVDTCIRKMTERR